MLKRYAACTAQWKDFIIAADEKAKVRLSFIRASGNIAAITPDIYENHTPAFEKLLRDEENAKEKKNHTEMS